MDRSVYEKFSQLFPSGEFTVNWGGERQAPEWGSLNGPTIFKRQVEILHINNDHEALKEKAAALTQEGNSEEAPFRFYEDDPRLFFDPGSGIESITALVFYA